VLNAIRTVPRHQFVDEALATRAYERHRAADRPRPDHLAAVGGRADDRVLLEACAEEGAGDRHRFRLPGRGARRAGLEVYTVERIGDLLRTARKRFRTLGLQVRSKHDDGRIGWPEQAPFDGIIVTAAAPALVDA
jgi:protein-L-isoaspartate(D-aspartate) O-methyltransferase